MRTLVLALLLLLPSISLAQVFEAPLTVLKGKGSYTAIEFMSAGESVALTTASAEDLPPTAAQTQALRVVVHRSEAYQTLVIETVTTGLEGCCGKVAEARSLDLEAFAAHFGFNGEVSGFVFSGWSSPESFRFTYQGKPFHATVTRHGQVRVVSSP